MPPITAPYGFVPLSSKVVTPSWVQQFAPDEPAEELPGLIDIPFEDGVCGTLDLTITAETPIFVRHGDSKEPAAETFFKLADGRYAIPGTALRGAVRNLVEVITFGRMRRVNDHRYSVRDLNNRDLYGQYMAAIVKDPRTGQGEPMPLVNAGWLEKGKGDNGDTATLTTCDFAKFEYQMLHDIAGARGVRGLDLGEKGSAVRKYKRWTAKREVSVRVRPQRPASHAEQTFLSEYGKVEGTGDRNGTIVFTGQPATYRSGDKKKKHHDFIFIEQTSPKKLSIEKAVFADFEFGHSNRGQQNRLSEAFEPNEEWKYWKQKFDEGERVPVFFLAETRNGRPEVKSFGLAMMYRLPYKHSIGDAVRRTQPGSEDAKLDFAEGLFGRAPGLDAKGEEGHRLDERALKGRVDFSHAIATGSPRALSPVVAVLGAPKASYYPNYVEQDATVHGALPASQGSTPLYRSWQDDDGRPRGWKRYQAMETVATPVIPENSTDRVRTRFVPLAAGTTFEGRLHLHNVRRLELGAILWALDFGGDTRARHALGMARPLGYGRCAIRARVAATGLDANNGDAGVDLNACRAEFEAYMESQVPGWTNSPQLRELRALATPIAPAQAAYQQLKNSAGTNEFVQAKKDGLALPMRSQQGPQPVATRRGASGPGSAGVATSQQRPSGSGTAANTSATGTHKASAPAPTKAAKGGEEVTVRLTELSPKGKWRCTILGKGAIGVLDGTPPEGAAAGFEATARVVTVGSFGNLWNLKWS